MHPINECIVNLHHRGAVLLTIPMRPVIDPALTPCAIIIIEIGISEPPTNADSSVFIHILKHEKLNTGD